VLTHDTRRAYEIARQIRTGNISQNRFRIDTGVAFGGFKQSGLGREGGVEGLRPYLETKTMLLDGSRGLNGAPDDGDSLPTPDHPRPALRV